MIAKDAAVSERDRSRLRPESVSGGGLKTAAEVNGKGSSRRMALLRRAGFFSGLPPAVEITRAVTLEDLLEAYRLVHDVFVDQGYIHPRPDGLRLRAFEALPDTATFVARSEGRVVGVTSVVMDSAEFGLPSDNAFSQEVEALRSQGRKVCEGTNWVLAEAYRNSPVLTELMRCSFAQARSAGFDDFIGVVSPGHARFFCLLGFEQLGPLRSYSREIDDPVVLMRLDLKRVDERIVDVENGESDEDEAVLKRYYIDTNPYHAYVNEWAREARELFSDEESLRDLFVEKGRLLRQCSSAHLRAICERWGTEIFAKVCGPAEKSKMTNPAKWRQLDPAVHLEQVRP